MERITSFDGVQLAVHRLGAGRPVLLLHGLFSSAETNWIKFGTAKAIADAGFEAIMPNLRAHGASAAPHDPAAYPADVLVRDVEALIAALGLSDYDLVGFSLGARTAIKAVLDGMTPRRLVLGGMGLSGLSGWNGRRDFFIDVIDRAGTIPRGDPAHFAQAFMKTQKIDGVAARLLLLSMGEVDTTRLDAITMSTLVLCGDQDDDNGSGRQLAEALPEARFVEVPGTHMSSIVSPAFGREIVSFLTA